jgi:carbamoyl-phosphate synthase large subunit
MKSVGEAMAIGRTFKESMQKCLRSLETGARGFGGGGKHGHDEPVEEKVINAKLGTPNAERVFFIRHAFKAGYSVDRIFDITKIDRWFLTQLREIFEMEQELSKQTLATVDTDALRRAKQFGFLRRAQLAHILKSDLATRRADRKQRRHQHDLPSGRHLCGGVRGVHAVLLFQLRRRERGHGLERQEEDHDPRWRSQPHRPGHRVRLLLRARELRAARDGLRDRDGELEPETVSTDYDTSDRLYFEPLTLEDVLEIYSRRAATA